MTVRFRQIAICSGVKPVPGKTATHSEKKINAVAITEKNMNIKISEILISIDIIIYSNFFSFQIK